MTSKSKNDIENISTVSAYDILDLAPDCSKKDIKKAYQKFVVKYHPDRPNGDAEMFQLGTDAYNKLINSESRKKHDEECRTSGVDHEILKGRSSDFYKMQKDSTKTKNEQENDFKKAFEEFDRKHGYGRSFNDGVITEKDTMRMFRDLELAREHDDIEGFQDKIFDEDVKPEEFNKVFDAMFGRGGEQEIIQQSKVPAAWNFASDFGTKFSSVANYEALYDESETVNNSVYSSVKFGGKVGKKLTKEEINKLEPSSYTKGHSYKDKDLDKLLDKKISDYKTVSHSFENRTIADFDTSPDCGGYSIFGNLGIGDKAYLDNDIKDKDLRKKYNRLLELRRQSP